MQTICITGLDGSGKSTQAKLLASRLPNSRIVSVWDIISKAEFQPWTIYKKTLNVEKYVMNLYPTTRSLFIFHAFNEAYQRALNSEVDFLIFDSHWYKYWAVEQAMDAPVLLGEFFKQQYPASNLTFYLQLSLQNQMKRKTKLSLYESGHNEKENLDNFARIQSEAKPILESLLPNNTIYLPGKNEMESLSNEIYGTVARKFGL